MNARFSFVLALGAAGLLAAAAGAASAAAARLRAKAVARPEAVPFIADDLDQAVRVARARHVPIFVESWAPW
ncbi:MAG: hypothetical protein ABI960_07895 [Candidatus Eisenbacteria bacterium]